MKLVLVFKTLSGLLLILLLSPAVDSVTVTHCPSPIRPKALLNHVQFNESVSIVFLLEMRLCTPANSTKQDVYFRLQSAHVNGRSMLMSNFDIYEKYGSLPKECVFRLTYNPSPTDFSLSLKRLGWYDTTVTQSMCDFQMFRCKSVLWVCPAWKEKEEYLARIFSDMLSPTIQRNETAVQMEPEIEANKTELQMEPTMGADIPGPEERSFWVPMQMREDKSDSSDFSKTWCGIYVLAGLLLTFICIVIFKKIWLK